MPSTTDAPPLAKHFASTEKKTRDKAVKNLAVFLSTAPENALTKSEMDKLWKGLFYCFWMSDKPLVQQALASELAELLLVVTSTTSSLAFLRGFWTTVVREWNGIDRLRIDKYYMLIRRFVNASFRLLIRTGWEEGACDMYNDILISKGGPLCSTDTGIPVGLPNHLCDIYLEELNKAIAVTSQEDHGVVPLGTLLNPFFSFMAQTQSSTMYERIQSSLIKPLLEALETPSRSDGERSLNCAQTNSNPYPDLIAKAGLDGPDSGSTDCAELKKLILRMIFKIASEPETKDSSRRKMYALWKEEGEDDGISHELFPALPISPMSFLPLDLHITILSYLPPSRCRLSDDPAIQTLVSCSQVNPLLREAASVPALWGPHYQTRYRHCNPNNEALRKQRHNSNWRLMYYERRRMDKVAFELIRDITVSRSTRNERALILSKMGLDIWDVLDIEAEEVPDFRSLSDVEPPDALTRRFWVRRMLDIIAVEAAIDVFATLLATADVPAERKASFEQTMLGLSAFFGKSTHDLTRILHEMAEECRAFVRPRTTLDVDSSEYSIPAICKNIVTFMVSKGFGPSPDHVLFDMMNHFPHAYLMTNKQTLPIALVHVFVSLARRLGLDASPINFPEKVLAHVKPPRKEEQSYYVNVFVRDPRECIIEMKDPSLHLSDPHLLNSIPHIYLSRYLDPADPSVMLLRAARNILVSYSDALHLPYDLAQGCLYLTLVVNLMFHGDTAGIRQIMKTVHLRPIDCATFFMDKLAPLLSAPSRSLLESHCKVALEDEAMDAAMVQLRKGPQPVRYCVGLPFRHKRFGYIACIIRWDTVCKAGNQWMSQMGVDRLEMGRYQPYYTSLVLDEHATQRYVAEENMDLIPLSEQYVDQFFEKHPNMAMYFQGVEYENSSKQEKRWRMILSPESRANYPEDDAIGSAWVREGILP